MGWEWSSAIIQHMFLKSPQRCTIIMFSFHITGCRSLLFIMLVLYVLFTAQCIITCHDLNAHSCAFSQGNMPPTSTYIKRWSETVYLTPPHQLWHSQADLLDIMFNICPSLSVSHFRIFFSRLFHFLFTGSAFRHISSLLCLWLVRFTLSIFSCLTSPLTFLLHDHPITNNMLH